MEGKLAVEDIQELDIAEDKRLERTSTDSPDGSTGVEEETSPGAGQPRGVSMVPKPPGEHLTVVQDDDSTERLLKLMRDLLKAAPVHVVWTSRGQIRIVADSPTSCQGSEGGVPEAKGAAPATRSPSVTSTQEALLPTEDEPQASLGKTLEPGIGDQRGYNVIRCPIGGKTRSRGEDDTEGGYERDQQGATHQPDPASPGADKKILPEDDFDQSREDGDRPLREGGGSPWVRVEEVPPTSGRASRSSPPGGLTGSPSVDPPGALQCNPSTETAPETRTKPGPGWWLRPNPACQLCNGDTIHCRGGFRIFGPPGLKGLEEELRQKLSNCHKWGADAHGTIFLKAKRLFSNYCLCPSGDSRAQTLAREAVLREITVAALQKTTLVGPMPSAHLRCSPTLQDTTSQHKHGDFSPSFFQWAVRKLKMLVKQTAPKS